MKGFLVISVIALLAGGRCMNVQAETVAVFETVPYSDLDASKGGDAARLFTRIDASAGRVCGPRERSGSIVTSLSWRVCKRAALRDAVVRINRPAVTAYAAAHGVVLPGALVARRN